MNPLSLNVTPESLAVVTFLCIGLVKFVDELFDRDWRGASKVAGSVFVGALAGHFVGGVGGLAGTAIGLSASGLIAGLSFVGSQSAAVPVLAALTDAGDPKSAVPAAMPIREQAA